MNCFGSQIIKGTFDVNRENKTDFASEDATFYHVH